MTHIIGYFLKACFLLGFCGAEARVVYHISGGTCNIVRGGDFWICLTDKISLNG